MQSKGKYLKCKENTFHVKCKKLDEEEIIKMFQGIDVYDIAEAWVEEIMDFHPEQFQECLDYGVVIDVKENDKDWRKILVKVERTLSFYSEDYKEENNEKV
jgi:hypothetical protein